MAGNKKEKCMLCSMNDLEFLKAEIRAFEEKLGKALPAERAPHMAGACQGGGCDGSCYCATNPNK